MTWNVEIITHQTLEEMRQCGGRGPSDWAFEHGYNRRAFNVETGAWLFCDGCYGPGNLYSYYLYSDGKVIPFYMDDPISTRVAKFGGGVDSPESLVDVLREVFSVYGVCGRIDDEVSQLLWSVRLKKIVCSGGEYE
ncbi:MAG TPA: hypothetical protein VLC08_13940 [Chitinolyticbacter sp.]|nr:hypothetical protein [Chitinolyticbacter sp.]